MSDTTSLLAPPPSGSSDGSLVRRYQTGDQAAATSLYMRYAHRLRALARRYMGDIFAGRFDSDDIIQSVFRTFFDKVKRRAYAVPPGSEIWGLLLVMTLNKVRRQVARHRAVKRDAGHTVQVPHFDHRAVLGKDETAAAFLQLVIEDELAELPEANRAIVRMRLEGYDTGEIADRVGRCRRTVERVLREFRDRLCPD